MSLLASLAKLAEDSPFKAFVQIHTGLVTSGNLHNPAYMELGA